MLLRGHPWILGGAQKASTPGLLCCPRFSVLRERHTVLSGLKRGAPVGYPPDKASLYHKGRSTPWGPDGPASHRFVC
jgi:hypothetical protein